MLNQFKYGIINAHAGDLPRFRGNACPNWALLVNENKIVLTLHKMTVDLDAGPILLQRQYPLNTNTYIKDIYEFLSENVPTMFVQEVEIEGEQRGEAACFIKSTRTRLGLDMASEVMQLRKHIRELENRLRQSQKNNYPIS
jgi:methionyl-tRNA formyltransferase